MSEVNLVFEIHCQRPPWGINNSISKFTDSRYRIYIDDDLITERSWIWDNNTFLYENIWIYGKNNTNYVLKIEPLLFVKEQAEFSISNFKVINLEAYNTKINDLQINFTLR